MAFTAKTRLNLILETLNILNDFGEEDILNGAINDSVTTLVSTDTNFEQYDKGVILEIEQELMRIDSKPTSTSITVTRGWRGTTAASHSDLAMIRFNPKYTQAEIVRLINTCLISELSQRKVNDATTTTSGTKQKYDLPTGVTKRNLREVWLRSSATDATATKEGEQILSYTFNDAQGTAGVDEIEFKFFPPNGQYLQYYYVPGFTELETDAASCDLPLNNAAHRLPVLYAAATLIPPRDNKRLRRDRNTYPSGSTPMNARGQSGEWYMREFKRIRKQQSLVPSNGFVLTVV